VGSIDREARAGAGVIFFTDFRRRAARAGNRLGLATLALWACLIALPAAAHATPTFLSAINLSAPGQDAFEPHVAVDSSGNNLAVWTRYDGTNTRIQALMRTPNGTFGPIETISLAGRDASAPNVAFDPSGNALAVWTQFDGANARIHAAFRPAGGSFGSPASSDQTISAAGGSADAPSVSFDSSGDAVAVWERGNGTNLAVQAAVRPASGSFGSPQTLSDPGQDAFEPQGAAGPNVDDNAVAIWTRFDGTKLRAQSSRRRDVPGYPRPKGATPMIMALVLAYNACGTSNRTHGPPFSSPSCNPPVKSSSVLTVGTLDANGFTANSISSVRFDAILGNGNNTVDDADVRVRVSMTDIRNSPSGTDYAGRVLLRVPLQITDRNNAAETPEPATAQTLALQLPVDCTTTIDTSIGATCSVSTSLDAVVPNTVTEGMRSIWEVGQAEVKDAGPNGTGYASCPPTCGDGDESAFMHEGIFTP
jgi:hypothetical protein